MTNFEFFMKPVFIKFASMIIKKPRHDPPAFSIPPIRGKLKGGKY